MTVGINAIIPSEIEVRFQVRKCNGLPLAFYPKYYKKLINTSDINPDLKTKSHLKILYSKAIAYYKPSTSSIINQTAIDNLAMEIARSFCNWNQKSFDESFNQIIGPKVDGLTDTIEFTYRTNQILSRRYSSNPFLEGINFSDDPEDGRCAGSTSSTDVEFMTPCFESYGQITRGSVGSFAVIPVFKNCFNQGILTQEFVRNEIISCGCGCNPSQTYIDFTVFGCTGALLENAEVELKLGGITKVTGLTGSDGKFRAGIAEAGTYDWTITKHILGTKRYTTSSGSIAMVCNDKKTQLTSLSAMPGFVCCSFGGGNVVEYPYSENLLVTYSAGSTIITWDVIQSAWVGSVLTFHDDNAITCPPPNGAECGNPTTSGDVDFVYRMFCIPPYDFSALWTALDCVGGAANILSGCVAGSGAYAAGASVTWRTAGGPETDFPKDFTMPSSDPLVGVPAPYPGLITISEILP